MPTPTTPIRTTSVWRYHYHCHGDPLLFLPRWEDIPQALQLQIAALGGLACDGGGVYERTATVLQ